LNCIDCEESSCSGACLQLLILGWIQCEQFQMSQKNSWSITLPFDLSCGGFFFLGDDGNFQVADCQFCCRSYRKHNVSSPVMNQLTDVPCLSALSIRSLQVLMWLSHWSCVRMRRTLCWATWDMFKSSDRMLWQVPWQILAAAMTSTLMEQLSHTSVATSWILSSVLTSLGQPVYLSSSKLSLPCAKHFCHLNPTPQLKASSL
jgi:hypothetical protein